MKQIPSERSLDPPGPPCITPEGHSALFTAEDLQLSLRGARAYFTRPDRLLAPSLMQEGKMMGESTELSGSPHQTWAPWGPEIGPEMCGFVRLMYKDLYLDSAVVFVRCCTSLYEFNQSTLSCLIRFSSPIYFLQARGTISVFFIFILVLQNKGRLSLRKYRQSYKTKYLIST